MVIDPIDRILKRKCSPRSTCPGPRVTSPTSIQHSLSETPSHQMVRAEYLLRSDAGDHLALLERLALVRAKALLRRLF